MCDELNINSIKSIKIKSKWSKWANVSIDGSWVIDELVSVGSDTSTYALKHFWENQMIFVIVDVFKHFWTH